MPAPEEAISLLKQIVGPGGFTVDAGALAPHLVEGRGLYQGKTPLMLRPATVDEVSQILAICHAHKLSVVPQGGNTGLVGGGIPDESGRQILVNLSRLNRIRSLDALNYTVTVEAGCILADVQRAAGDSDRLMPLSLGAEGSCQIGGNISTNAGGVAVLKYGSMRELVLGLEVVLADGSVWHGLSPLRKDNTGYDLKQLFIGAEGTLGIITAATLKLFPKVKDRATAIVALPNPSAATRLLALARGHSGDAVSAFELMPRLGLDFVLRHISGTRDPLAVAYPWYVLIELTSANEEAGLTGRLERILAVGMEQGLILDGAIAANLGQAQNFWKLRETIPEAQKPEGGSIKHDISVPVSEVAAFIDKAAKAVEAALPGIRPVPFGHMGDGNVHFNLSQPKGADKAEFLARWPEISRIVHDIVTGMGGSISAEHGIGRLKLDELARYKSPAELAVMRRVKTIFDPQHIMNPNRIFTLKAKK